ncbi:hypothetical protein [Sphingomonas sp.]|uniref:hypothetical protein n=1 Tax=Sphingomonas sp. TaxID=28214 RepID=UPI003B004648
MSTEKPASVVRDHLAGVRSFECDVNVAPDSQWTVVSGKFVHRMSVQQSYRFITQAWDFPIVSGFVSEISGTDALAELQLDNGNGYMKQVAAQYRVDDGRIVQASLKVSQASQMHG